MRLTKRGQTTLEWVVFTVVFIGVIVAMRPYLVAVVSGRVRQIADQFGHGRQYAPGITTITRE